MQSYYQSTTPIFTSPDYDPIMGATMKLTDPGIIWIHGHAIRVTEYQRDPQLFFRWVVGTVSHETIHQVILDRLQPSPDPYIASASLDNPVLNDEEEMPDICGVHLGSLDAWLDAARYAVR